MKRNLLSLFVLFLFCLSSHYVWGANKVGDTFSYTDAAGNRMRFTITKVYQDASNYGECSVTKYPDATISGALTIPTGAVNLTFDNVKCYYYAATIADDAFKGCTGLTSISIGGSHITSIGKNAFDGCTNIANSVSFSSNLVTIDDYAFRNCSTIAWTTLTIPAKVKTIGQYAFYNCKKPTTLTIGTSVETIGKYAFYGCSSLTTVQFGGSSTAKCNVDTIGILAFSSCSKINKVICFGDATQWLKIKFGGSTANPVYYAKGLYSSASSKITSISTSTGVTRINPYAFYNDTLLTSVTVGTDVTSIGTYAFYGCSNVEYIIAKSTTLPTVGSSAFNSVPATIPVCVPSSKISAYKAALGWSSFTNISAALSGNCGAEGDNATWSLDAAATSPTLTISGTGAMADYSSTSMPWNAEKANIKTIIVKNGITKIGKYAFSGCTNATTIKLGTSSSSDKSTVSEIASSAFSSCSSMSSVYFYETIDKWLNIAFESTSSAPFYGVASETTDHMFYLNGTTSLTMLTIPAEIVSIPQCAFYGMNKIETLTFAGSPTTIGSSAFRYCSGLKALCLPKSVTEVGTYAFANCSGLQYVLALSSNPPTLGLNAFYNNTSIPVYVPSAAAEEAYKAADVWKTFKNGDVSTIISQMPSGSCGTNLTWTMDLLNGVLTISGTGEMENYGTGNKAPWLSYEALIQKIIVNEGVTKIGSYAFEGIKTSLMEVRIPSSITSWGSNAFSSQTTTTGKKVYFAGTIAQWCAFSFGSLASNPIYYSKEIYINGNLLENLIIPDGVTSIGAYTFAGGSYLNSVSLPASLTSVGTNAFQNCNASATINFRGTAVQWCGICFAGETGCNPASVAKNLSLNGEVATDIYLPDDLAQIGDYAFLNNQTLEHLSINTATAIGKKALDGCTAEIEFRGNAGGVCADGLSWSLIDGVLTISGTGAMADYTSTNAAAWYPYRSSITKVVVEEGVSKIGNYAFYNGNHIAEMQLPSTITSIGSYALSGCSALEKLSVAAVTAPTIPDTQSGPSSFISYTFTNVPTSCAIYIPAGSYTSYSTAQTSSHNTSSGWKRFTNYCAEGTCGTNLTWSYSWATHTLEIAGEGEMFNYNSTHAPWYNFAEDIQTIIIGENVTKIGSIAFRYCNNVTALYYNAISATVSFTSNSSSSNQSFYELGKDGAGFTCYVGPQVTALPNGMFCPAYQGGQYGVSVYGRPKLISIVFAEEGACTTIGSQAFLRATDLTQITIPATITSIGNSAFDNCTNLTRTDYTGTIAQWCNITFGNSSANPINYTKNLYIGNSLVTELEVPEGVIEVKSYAFTQNTALTSVTLPTTLTSMGSSVFEGCSNVTTVTSQAVSVPTITANTFPTAVTSNATLIVPAAAESAYRTATGWQKFARIKPYGEVWETVRTGLANGQIGTQCVAYPIKDIRGAEIYRLSDKETTDTGNPLNVTIVEDMGYASRSAGTPFIFRADGSNDGNMDLLLDKTDEPVEDDINENGLIGLLSQEEKEISNNGTNLFLSGGALWIAGDYCYVAKNRAYIDFNSITPEIAPAAARRLTLRRGDATTTELSNIPADATNVYKVLRDGQLVITKNGKSYSILGQSIQ